MLKFKEILVAKQKQKQQRINKYISVLQKCTKIQFADRLNIRKMLIDKDQIVMNIFEGIQETVSLQEVQAKLKKLIFNIKASTPKNQSTFIKRVTSQKRFYVQNQYPHSCKNSKQVSPAKQEKRKTILLDVGQIMRKLKSKEIGTCGQESRSKNDKYKMKRNNSQRLYNNPEKNSTNTKMNSANQLSSLRKNGFSATQPVKNIKCVQIEKQVSQFHEEIFGQIKQSYNEQTVALKTLIKQKIKNTNKKITQKNDHNNEKGTDPDNRFGKFYLKIKDIMQGNLYKL